VDHAFPAAVSGWAGIVNRSRRICLQVACGAHHCLVATRSGAVYSWGLNADNQLGHGKLGDNDISLSHPRHIDAVAGQHISQVTAIHTKLLASCRYVAICKVKISMCSISVA